MLKLDEPRRFTVDHSLLPARIPFVSGAEPIRTNVADDQTTELVQILDAYLAELQAGLQPDRERLLAEHPRLA